MTKPPLTVFYDGACPICALEIDALRRRDACGRLHAIDIAAPGFVAEQHGFSRSALDASIHVVAADGEIARGAEALRRIYGAVGLGWLVAPTAWPGLRALADAAYAAFARRRRRISAALAPFLALRSGAIRRGPR
jgi:predicted DCC family thiol-disulfide oxidoreductase YuxK